MAEEDKSLQENEDKDKSSTVSSVEVPRRNVGPTFDDLFNDQLAMVRRPPDFE